jgi:pimeloyl-ACP methyl ester carboxylesterase
MKTVTSRDGTQIGYTQVGQGPGLILVQGAMGTAYNYRDLAQALSHDFSVYTPDRRGRGMSPCPYTPDHCIQREVEDVQALSVHTGARYIFGLSSGGVIALTSACRLDSIHKAIIYEPPFYFRHGIDKARVEQFNRDVTRKLWVRAMTTAGEIVKLAPLPLRMLPRPLRLLATRLTMGRLEGGKNYATLRELLPAMRFDFQVVGEMSQDIQIFKALNKDVLLLGGTRIPGYLRDSLAELEKTLLKANRITFPGLDHSAPWNGERGGAPLLVAEAIRSFLR